MKYFLPLSCLGFFGAMCASAVAQTTLPIEALQPQSEANAEFNVEATIEANVEANAEPNADTSTTSAAMSQVTSVSQLEDVEPTDWAYQALRSLVERYGCIAGYPDGTYRGNRPTTRYEFAAGLNACLDRINELIATGFGDIVTQEDLTVIQRLQSEFAAELAVVRGRVDDLEDRTTTLEANQFSTTTKLNAEAIIAVSDSFGELGEFDTEVSTVLQNRVRLNFDTSFTGRDRLRTRLQAGDAEPLLLNRAFFENGFQATDTQEGRFTYDGDVNNDANLDLLSYSFPIGDDAIATVFANGGQHHYYADTVNPFLEGNGGGQNALSRFSERNPIYRIGGSGAGAAVSVEPSDNLRVDIGYLSSTASSPGADQGLFNGNYSALGQVVVGDRFKIGLTYVHAYENRFDNVDANRINFGGTGTSLANLNPIALFGVNALRNPEATIRPVVSNSYGLEASLAFSPRFVVNGWVGKTNARLIGLGDADIWNFAVGLALPDLGREGNLAGLTFGAAPTLRSLDIPGGAPFLSRDFAYQVEGFYRLQLNDNISVTPGVIWVTAPNQNNDNRDAVIGTVRTTFRF